MQMVISRQFAKLLSPIRHIRSNRMLTAKVVIILYKCICGREFDNKQSYNSHQGRCKINRESKGKEVIDTFNKHNKHNSFWNKGLTKDTDLRIKNAGELYSQRVKNGEIIPSFRDRHHTNETKKKMSETAKQQVKEGKTFCICRFN